MGEGQHRKDATNEELASQAKTGDRAALAALWEQNRGSACRSVPAAVYSSGREGDAGRRYMGGRGAMRLSCHRAGCAGV